MLVGGPKTPSARDLEGAKAAALVAGENEPQRMMRQGARALAAGGIPARFWELPGATHGAGRSRGGFGDGSFGGGFSGGGGSFGGGGASGRW